MTTENPKTPADVPNSIDQGANYLISVLAEGNPAKITAAVQHLSTQFTWDMTILMLDAAGKKIGATQQYWGQLGQRWFAAIQSAGTNSQLLPMQVNQILSKNATKDTRSST